METKEKWMKYGGWLLSLLSILIGASFLWPHVHVALLGIAFIYLGIRIFNFSTFEVGEEEQMYLNLELKTENKNKDFGRIIFYTDDVDKLYSYLSSDQDFAELTTFENEPTTADWGERFFHLRDPDHYQLSFAMPITSKEKSLVDHN